MPNLSPTEIILILLVVILLFGARRLPDTARGLGRALRIFKSETKGLRDDADRADRADRPRTVVDDTVQRPAPPPPPREIAAPTEIQNGQPAKDAERSER